MATWPSSLPPFNLPVSEERQDTTIRTNMDVGPAKVRRRSTAGSVYYNLTMRMSGSQYQTLINFYNSNISFLMEDPNLGSQYTFRFLEPPVGEARKGESDPNKRVWDVNVKMERLP